MKQSVTFILLATSGCLISLSCRAQDAVLPTTGPVWTVSSLTESFTSTTPHMGDGTRFDKDIRESNLVSQELFDSFFQILKENDKAAPSPKAQRAIDGMYFTLLIAQEKKIQISFKDVYPVASDILAHSKDDSLKFGTVMTLDVMGGEETSKILMPYLRQYIDACVGTKVPDLYGEVGFIVVALGHSKSNSSASLLAELFKNPNHDDIVQAEAVIALGEIGVAKDFDHLIEGVTVSNDFTDMKLEGLSKYIDRAEKKEFDLNQGQISKLRALIKDKYASWDPHQSTGLMRDLSLAKLDTLEKNLKKE